jgi:hypothetical protein
MPRRRARALSILYRARGWLTLAQLLPAWASELADSKTNADQIERDLKHFPSWWGNATGGSQEGKSVELTNVAPRRAPITPAAAVVGTWTAPRPRKGPAPGTVDRFGESDRALFPEIERIMREGHETVHAAALELASAGKIQGGGTPESRAKRLALVADHRS